MSRNQDQKNAKLARTRNRILQANGLDAMLDVSANLPSRPLSDTDATAFSSLRIKRLNRRLKLLEHDLHHAARIALPSVMSASPVTGIPPTHGSDTSNDGALEGR